MRYILLLSLLLLIHPFIAACPTKSANDTPEEKAAIKKEEISKEPKVDLGKELYNTDYNNPQKLLNARQLAVKNLYETKEIHEQEVFTESDERKEKVKTEKAIKDWMKRVE